MQNILSVLILFTLSSFAIAIPPVVHYESVVTPGTRLIAGSAAHEDFYILGAHDALPVKVTSLSRQDVPSVNRKHAENKSVHVTHVNHMFANRKLAHATHVALDRVLYKHWDLKMKKHSVLGVKHTHVKVVGLKHTHIKIALHHSKRTNPIIHHAANKVRTKKSVFALNHKRHQVV